MVKILRVREVEIEIDKEKYRVKAEKLEKAVGLSRKTGFIMVATASMSPMPHMATAGKMEITDGGYLAVTEWFCPGTIDNLQENKNVSVVVWDKSSDTGYQMLGKLERTEELGILNGYAPELKGRPPLPQVERRLLIKVQKITDFKLGPHSDVEN